MLLHLRLSCLVVVVAVVVATESARLCKEAQRLTEEYRPQYRRLPPGTAKYPMKLPPPQQRLASPAAVASQRQQGNFYHPTEEAAIERPLTEAAAERPAAWYDHEVVHYEPEPDYSDLPYRQRRHSREGDVYGEEDDEEEEKNDHEEGEEEQNNDEEEDEESKEEENDEEKVEENKKKDEEKDKEKDEENKKKEKDEEKDEEKDKEKDTEKDEEKDEEKDKENDKEEENDDESDDDDFEEISDEAANELRPHANEDANEDDAADHASDSIRQKDRAQHFNASFPTIRQHPVYEDSGEQDRKHARETRYFHDIFMRIAAASHNDTAHLPSADDTAKPEPVVPRLYGHVEQSPRLREQRMESVDPRQQRYRGEVIWTDSSGGYGEHRWDMAQGKL